MIICPVQFNPFNIVQYTKHYLGSNGIFCLSFFPCQVLSELKWVNIIILYVCCSSLFIKPISFLYIKYDGADFFTKRNKFIVWANTLVVLLSLGSWSKQQHPWYLGYGPNSNTLPLWWTVQYTHILGYCFKFREVRIRYCAPPHTQHFLNWWIMCKYTLVYRVDTIFLANSRNATRTMFYAN